MSRYICATCAAQFAESDSPPAACPICDDERQYVGWDGQQWTTLDDLRADHRTLIKEEEPNLIGIGVEPAFAINQRALLVQTPEGNALWEASPFIDDAAIEAVRAHGGIRAIAISHPHMAASMVEWSHAFDHAPIYLHATDRAWVQRPDPAIVHWEGDTHALGDGLTLIHCGGHFEGSAALHWQSGAEGRGALLAGDTLYVTQDRRHVSFMRSYPNHIPLNAAAVRHVAAMVEPYPYDRIYSAWFGRAIVSDAKAAVKRSAERYIQAIGG